MIRSSLSLGLLAIVAGLVRASAASDYSGDFRAFKEKVALERRSIELQRRREKEANNPDAWILSANWAFEEAKDEDIRISTKPPDKDDLRIVDPKTHETVGSLESTIRYRPAKVDEAIGYLREAQKRWPHRLDIYCGLATVCQKAGRPEQMMKALKELAASAKDYRGHLRWCHDEPLEAEASATVASKLHGFAVDQLNEGTPESRARFAALAKLIITTSPRAAQGHNDLAVVHSLAKNYPAMQRALESAAKVAPKDSLVWFNLATNSLRLGKMARGREAYQRVIGIGDDPRLVQDTKDALKGLPKK